MSTKEWRILLREVKNKGDYPLFHFAVTNFIKYTHLCSLRSFYKRFTKTTINGWYQVFKHDYRNNIDIGKKYDWKS